MSKDNVEIVRRGFEDSVSLLDFEYFAPDVQFDLTSIYPDQPILSSVEAMLSFSDAAWGESIHFEPERYFDVDDERVLVFMRVTATGRGSGVPVSGRTGHEFRFRDGLIVYVKIHPDRSEALKAMGLEP